MMVARPNRPLTPQMKKFLRAFSRVGQLRPAARALGITKSSHFWWLRSCKRYRKAFNRARRLAGYLRQDVLDKLVLSGQPKFHDGEQVFIYFDAKRTPVPKSDAIDGAGRLRKGFKRKPATEVNVTALIFALKADFPEKYRERQEVKHTGIPKSDSINEQVKQLLADRESTELANSLARRMALNARGNGQSAN